MGRWRDSAARVVNLSPEPVAAAYVSADTFGLLGERPVLGRASSSPCSRRVC